MPDYLRNHPVYYAGPAKTPEGFASGSFGPTTAGRMDSYVDLFQSHGGSMIMLAKGNRSKDVSLNFTISTLVSLSRRSLCCRSLCAIVQFLLHRLNIHFCCWYAQLIALHV